MKKEQKDPCFVNKVVKQGNSLCVRIPNSVVKELELEKGNDVAIGIHKVDYKKLKEKYQEEFMKTINKIPELKKMNELKKKFFTTLTFELLEKTHDNNEKSEEKKREDFLLKFKKEFGDELFNEYVKFGEIINKHATIIEKDGSIVIKPKFR